MASLSALARTGEQAPATLPHRPHRAQRGLQRQETIAFHIFASPWIFGFLVFTLLPMAASIAMSFTHYEIITPARWVGLGNYRKMLIHDPLIRQSLKVTTLYAVGSVSIGTIAAFLVALLMNQKIALINLWRTIYYLPSTLSGVPVALLWMWIFKPQYGLLDTVLSWVGIEGTGWLLSPTWALPSLIIMSLWGVGGGMVIYLAGLQSIPEHLYEAASLDGANAFAKFRHITVPMVSPVIFFNLVMGIIGAFHTFTAGYVMTGGGPVNATLFYALYLYRKAFTSFDMGYACAMAWLLFAIIMLLTLAVFRSSPLWVYYEGELGA